MAVLIREQMKGIAIPEVTKVLSSWICTFDPVSIRVMPRPFSNIEYVYAARRVCIVYA